MVAAQKWLTDVYVGRRQPGRPRGPSVTMRAIVQDRYGSLDVFIRRSSTGPNPASTTCWCGSGGRSRPRHLAPDDRPAVPDARLGFGFRRPKNRVPGLDVAGTVVAVGPAVTRFAVGDEVYGVARGSYAEYAAAHEDKLARKPANVTFEQAAVVPVSGLIAQRGLVDVGRLQAGQRVLITGASGGVGSYAVQLAKALGAEVTAVSSASKADLVRSLGADHVIDYTREDFADGTRRYDLILDIAGNPTLRPAAPRAHPARDRRHPRRRTGRARHRRLRPDTAGAAPVPVRQPTPHDGHRERERPRPGTPHRPHRGRAGDATRRPHLPPRGGAGRPWHASSRARSEGRSPSASEPPLRAHQQGAATLPALPTGRMTHH